MIYLNKILPYFVYPITIIIILMIWSATTRKRLPIILALCLFFISSCPIISNQMVSYLESKENKKMISDMSEADSVVVLSGMIGPIMTNQGIFYEWGDPDRFFGGIELLKAGKAKNIIFTGGILPWQRNIVPEGKLLAKFAEDFGIPNSRIIVTGNVENTHDEAKAVKEILTKNHSTKIILVTSAFHMQRASNLFVKEGIDLQTYPVDYKAKFHSITLLDFLPSADAFYMFHFAMRELIGRAYYTLRNRF